MKKQVSDAARAQDAFAELVEQCRIGTVYRCELQPEPNRTKYIPHKPGIELDIPVFYLGELGDGTDGKQIQAALESMMDNQLRLPYPRCGFLSQVSADNPALARGPQKYRTNLPRLYLTVAEEEEAGILFFGFLRNADMGRWAKQIWQISVGRGREGVIHLAFDPEAGTTSEDFLSQYRASLQSRLFDVLTVIHRLMSASGTATHVAGTAVTDRINERRRKLRLSEVSRIRVIDFNAPARIPEPMNDRGQGAPKSPHFRRATWRTLATGQRVFVRASAIHGGGSSPPPWYEVKP